MIKREREEMNFRLVVSTHEFTAIETTMQKYFDDTWVLSGWWELCKQKSHETFVVSWDEKKVFLINNKQKWNGVHLTMHDTIIWIFFSPALTQSLSDYLIEKNMITSLLLEVITPVTSDYDNYIIHLFLIKFFYHFC